MEDEPRDDARDDPEEGSGKGSGCAPGTRTGKGRRTPGLVRGVARALTLRCPACGAGGLVRRWVRIRASCPRCGLRTDRGEHDHFLGAMAVNLVAAELTLAVLLAAAMAAAWPDPPWRLLTWGGAALAVLLPVAFYPFAKLVWLALDLRFRSAGDRQEEPTEDRQGVAENREGPAGDR